MLLEDMGEQFEGREAVEVHSAEDVAVLFHVFQRKQDVVGQPAHHIAVVYHRKAFEQMRGQGFLTRQLFTLHIHQFLNHQHSQLIH